MALLSREDILTAEMPDGAKRLWRFADRVAQGEHPNPDDMKALALAFERILDGDDPKKALGLSGRQGQGRPGKTLADADKELELVTAVDLLRSDSKSRAAALEEVSKERGVPFDTLEKYYKDRSNKEAAKWCVAIIQRRKREGK